MAKRPVQLPPGPLVDTNTGTPTRAGLAFLTRLQRFPVEIDKLSGSVSNTDLRDKVNEIVDILNSNDFSETP